VKAAEAAGMPKPEMIATNLSNEEEGKMRESFGF
jgi:hypothetical protein